MDHLKRWLTGGALVIVLLSAGLFTPALIPPAGADVFTASSPVPDLAIDSLTTSPEKISIGDTVTFTVTIKNQGDGQAGTCMLAGYIDEQILNTVEIDPLDANNTVVKTFTWKAKAGPHTFRAVIDSEAGVAESNEGNNDRTIAFSVTAPDLTIKALTWTPVSPAMGDNVTFVVTIANQGDKKSGSCQLDFSIDGNSRGYRTLLAIEPAASVNETYSWAALSGLHKIKAVADAIQQVNESDETNNALEATLSTALPDLIVDSITPSPTSIMAGDNVTLSVVIKNRGTGRAEPSIVQCFVDNTLWDYTYTDFLGPGEVTTNITFEWTSDDNPHIFKIIADATNIVPESDETNNTATLASPLVLPDLVIQDITWSPAPPVINSPMLITITVKNQGKSKSGQTDLKYGINTIYQFTAMVSELAPGDTVWTKFMWTPAYPTFSIKAAVDTANVTKESNESNNTLAKTVTCINPAPTADLAVVSLAISPARPVLGDTGTLSLSVKNQGTGKAEGSFAAIYLEDNRINTVYIDALDAGTTITKNIPISLQGLVFETSYKVRVELDCNNTVLETNEFNNIKEIAFSVAAPDLAIQGIHWTPELPSTGDRMTFDVNITNRGDARAESTNIAYYVDNIFAGRHAIEAIDPGGSTTRSFTWTVQREPFTITAIIDEAKEITEPDRSNNSKSVTLPAPDLFIDAAAWSPERPAELDSVTFSITVRNRGYGPAPSTLLYCYIDSAAPLCINTGAIVAGGTGSVKFSHQFIAGEHTIRLVADGDGAITESDETNNEKTFKLTVQPLPTTVLPSAIKATGTIAPTTPRPSTTPALQNTASNTTEISNIAANITAPPPAWQKFLLNRWLLIGVAVLGISAIGLLLLLRKKGKKA
jgi:subtilase family serine protease